MTLTDMLDELIGEQRMDPQLAMKILSNFDRAITETLNDKVKARLTFKVNTTGRGSISHHAVVGDGTRLLTAGTLFFGHRARLTRTVSATKSGPSLSRTSHLRWRTAVRQ